VVENLARSLQSNANGDQVFTACTVKPKADGKNRASGRSSGEIIRDSASEWKMHFLEEHKTTFSMIIWDEQFHVWICQLHVTPHPRNSNNSSVGIMFLSPAIMLRTPPSGVHFLAIKKSVMEEMAPS
jgi:hypothetical protein